VDQYGIPLGSIEAYPGLTAKEPFTLGEKEPDIDDCFVFASPTSSPSSTSASPGGIDTRGEQLRVNITAHNANTKLNLQVLSTEPAFQFYTGKYIETPALREGDSDAVTAKGARSGFCLEPSRYVNAVNVPEWKDQVLLKKGSVYGTRIVYRAWEGAPEA
jgi:aldose 1-epimerase